LRRIATQVFRDSFDGNILAFIASSPGMPMSNRSGKLFSTVLAAVLGGGVCTMVSYVPARADETCLSGPKAATPRGSHWYYRVEAGTKRHCWYLGEERGKTAQAAAAKPSSPAPTPDKPAETSAATPLQPAVSNARAEFVDATPASDPTRPASSPPQDAASVNNAAQTAEPSKSTVTTRWPDPAISVQPPQPAPAPAAAPAAKPSTQLVAQRSEPGPAVRIASASPPQASSYSMPMLLGGLAGALAFAGFLGFAVVKFGHLNGLGRIRRRPESIWDNIESGHPPPWQAQQEANRVPPSSRDPLRARQDIEAQSRDILELLSRASREAAT
jgi:hypothetical protein